MDREEIAPSLPLPSTTFVAVSVVANGMTGSDQTEETRRNDDIDQGNDIGIPVGIISSNDVGTAASAAQVVPVVAEVKGGGSTAAKVVTVSDDDLVQASAYTPHESSMSLMSTACGDTAVAAQRTGGTAQSTPDTADAVITEETQPLLASSATTPDTGGNHSSASARINANINTSINSSSKANAANALHSTRPRHHPPLHHRRRRVLVLGAGMAGLAAANELQTRGYDVLVVEARSRVGGRLKSTLLHASSAVSSTASKAKSAASKKATKANAAAVPSSPSPSRHKPKAPSDTPSTSNSNSNNVASTNAQWVDIGGALIHGVTGNPVYDLVSSDMGMATRPVAECLLLTNSGWPVDVTEDERISQAFNECLDDTFRRINQAFLTTSHTNMDENGSANATTDDSHDTKHKSNGNCVTAQSTTRPTNFTNMIAQMDTSKTTTTTAATVKAAPADTMPAVTVATDTKLLDPSSSFGHLFEHVCLERNVNCKTALFQWHQANLEVSCGAPFSQLGWHWNDDEPYGYEGDHAALCASWQTVCDRLAEPLSILYQSPVCHVQIVPPMETTTTTEAEEPTVTDDNATTAEADDEPAVTDDNATTTVTKALSTDTTAETSRQMDTNQMPTNSNNRRIDLNKPKPSSLKRKAANGCNSRKRRKNEMGLFAILSPPERYSRRIRNEGTHAPRRSVRSNKGAGIVDRFTFDHSTEQLLGKLASPTKKVKKPVTSIDSATDDDDASDHTVVQVRLVSGETLQADAVVCTLPLAMLKVSDGDNAISFDPPLPLAKQQAIQRLGTGLLNKCALRFPKQFWQDSDFLGLADTRHSYLVLNVAKYSDTPVLLFMYGGSFAKEMEDWSDAEVVEDCLAVLRRMCGRDLVLAPLDYHVTRWGKETYSRMSFTYVPPGVDGHAELQAMGSPIYDHTGHVPVLMFAGEHTTPFHPSTIHGAFISGIREAYRLDCVLDPASNGFLKFTDDDVFQKTFTLRRKGNGLAFGEARSDGTDPPRKIPSYTSTAVARPLTSPSGSTSQTSLRYGSRGAAGIMQLRSRPRTHCNLGLSSPVARKTALNTEREQVATAAKIDQAPSRRSQRSTTASVPFVLESTASSAGTGMETTKGTNDQLDRDELGQENRTLQRGLESYGDDYEYIRAVMLPVHGSFADQSAQQVQYRCQRLQMKRNKVSQNRQRSQASTWPCWVAKKVALPNSTRSEHLKQLDDGRA